jgi:hypothetical protein
LNGDGICSKPSIEVGSIVIKKCTWKCEERNMMNKRFADFIFFIPVEDLDKANTTVISSLCDDGDAEGSRL